MPKNLRNKVMLILEDAETLNKFELARKIELLVTEEVSLVKVDHEFGPRDLTTIESGAKYIFTNTPLSQFNDNGYGSGNTDLRAWSYVSSVIGFLRQKGLISFNVTFEKAKKS